MKKSGGGSLMMEIELKNFSAELHVHTLLSPCAELEMIPPLIVQEALDRNIDLIAITDHNATANIEAVQKAAAGSGLKVLPGMELQTREEVHLLCLFDTLEQAYALQEQVDRLFPPIPNNPDYFGEQFVVDATGDFICREERLLLASIDIGLHEAVEFVGGLGGLAIPAHVDRKAYGLLEVLGFVPTDVPIEALEVSRNVKIAEAPDRFPQVRGYPLLQGGDAHRLEELLGANHFTLAKRSVDEIRLALRGVDGRNLKIVRDG
jgi:PHP family Zn ribbon phosphoesterase